MSKVDAKAGCLFWVVVASTVVTAWWVACLLFQYSLWVAFGKDVPWYFDLLGATVLNAANLPVAVLCLILQLAGVPTPFFPN